MNQFNQAAAEAVAKQMYENTALRGFVVDAIREYCEQSQPLPTPEIIEFDLEKLKSGGYNLELKNGTSIVRYKWDEEYQILMVDYGNGTCTYAKDQFIKFRLIRKPVPTKKVWKNVFVGIMVHDNEETAIRKGKRLANYYETICIEEPIKNS